MNNYLFLLFFLFISSEPIGQSQKSLVEYDGQPIRIKCFKGSDKEYRKDNYDVHFKLKITDNRLKDLTNEELENGIRFKFIDSLGNNVQPGTLGFVRYAESRDIGEIKETDNLKPEIILRNHGSLADIKIPIRRRIKRKGGEGIIGYRFHTEHCSIRTTVLVGEEKQELLIPLIIK
jgi:hypothetical protein